MPGLRYGGGWRPARRCIRPNGSTATTWLDRIESSEVETEVSGRKAAGVASFLREVLLPLAMICSFAPNAPADYIPPSRVVVRTNAYRPQETNFPHGSYDYQVSWEGIPVGNASIHVATIDRGGAKMFDVEATACSGTLLSLFYRLRHRSEAIFSAHDLRPVEFRYRQTENSRFTNLKIDFAPDGLIDARITKGRLNGSGKSEEVSFKSENATFDPISAAFLARSLPMHPGEDFSFDVFNGEDRYLISLHVMGREEIEVAGRHYDAVKIRPRVRKLTDTEGEKRVHTVFLWLSTDGRRELLKVESKVRLGSISANLVGFLPDGSAEARRSACE
jgi:Protein of unknown function (DUF3108)